LAEDHALHTAARLAQRGPSVLALHVLRDFETPQCFDLPLRRAAPYRVASPDDVVRAKALDELSHHRRAQARLGDSALRKDLAEIPVYVRDAVPGRYVGEIGHPVDPSGAVELLDALPVRAAGEAERRVV